MDMLLKFRFLQRIPFDGVCLIPFFSEGGRITANNIHWVQEGAQLIPAALTPYARDPVFGYQNSCLPKWIEEKTKGKICASNVKSISIEDIRQCGPGHVTEELVNVENGEIIVVNALTYSDLAVFMWGLLDAESLGKQFLFRTASSFAKVSAGLTDSPLLVAKDLLKSNAKGGGLIVIGSCVPKSTAQLEFLLNLKYTTGVEFRLNRVFDEKGGLDEVCQVIDKLESALSLGQDAIVYTSRHQFVGDTINETQSIHRNASLTLMEVVKRLTIRPKYVIGKGGITSSDLATIGLGVQSARILGQIYPGIPVWRLGNDSRWPGIPYIVFPGNVGENETLADIVKMLRL
jgi:uncharacterized protein YgbK (DUF1537 family)